MMMLFSALKYIFFNCVYSKSVLSRCHFPRSASIIRNCTSLSDVYKPFSIARTVQSTSETLKIEFDDCAAAEFYYVWLRDNCSCKKCLHPHSQEKLIDTASLDLNISPRFCHVTNTGNLKIVWPEGYHEHPSFYDPKWLHRFALGFENNIYEEVHDFLPSVKYWTEEILKDNFPEIEYGSVMQSLTGVYTCLKNIHEYGMQIIKNVPCEPGEIIKVMNRIAHIKDTKWGSSFHITSDGIFSDPSCLRCVKEKTLELHTDMNYLEKSPGIQAVHCLQANNSGTSFANVEDDSNKLFFVDGFYIAQWLKEEHPLHFKTLTFIPVKFQKISENMRYLNYQPILKLNRSREVTEVHFNNRMMAPLEGPSSSIMDFYAAYKIFAECVKNPENQISISLNPGDVVILNNRRVLRGRYPHDPRGSTKHLEGCYVDMDEILARYRAFLMKKLIKS